MSRAASRRSSVTTSVNAVAFPLFSLVKIPATSCVGSSGDNGTCYTAGQCRALNGAASGSCGGGFGVCCIFQETCGGTASQNCTYFVNENYPQAFNGVGSCQITVEKLNDNVCQLRLDFQEFVLAGPETTDNLCVNDRFSVSGGTTTPSICGVNTGQHMYVTLGPGTTTPPVLTAVTLGTDLDRKWKIKITQIPCNTPYTAPSNCLQYYTGVTGTVLSYNYDTSTGLQLSNQDYTTCIRTEKNFCGIQYTACTDAVNTDSESFTVTGSSTSSGEVGANNCNNDWLTIPCLSENSLDPFSNCQDRICGGAFSITGNNVDEILYSFVRPFNIFYHTNGVEENDGDTNNRGFCLNYVQQPCL
ncbi:CUB domain [Trinorchestia longiramus]|nr:CUB domain [Trinorchestia longiramus]